MTAARAAAEHELRLSPNRPDAWLRLAYIDTYQAGGKLTPVSLHALKAAYRLLAYDDQIARWRLPFIFSHWSEADPELRDRALSEMRHLWKRRASRAWLGRLPRETPDAAGRLAATLQIDLLRRKT